MIPLPVMHQHSPRTCKLRMSVLIALHAMCAIANVAHASEWTYRGVLQDGGAPAEGRYDLRLTLLDARDVAPVIGPIIIYGVVVKNGQFVTEVDFGAEVSQAGPLQLRTEVASADGTFVAIGEPTQFDPKGTPAMCWETHGNLGTDGANDFIGTVDDQPFNIVVNDRKVGRIDGSASGYNVSLGSPFNAHGVNSVASLVLGGGGNPQEGNHALSANAALLGGLVNYAGLNGTVAGGSNNYAGQGAFASGTLNCAGGYFSHALGHRAKVRVPQSAGGNLFGPGCEGVAQAADATGDSGTFIWADDQPADFVSTADRQFLVRASGGFLLNGNTMVAPEDDVQFKTRGNVANSDMDLRLVTANDKSALLKVKSGDGSIFIATPNLTGNKIIDVANGAFLTTGGAWVSNSSRTLKHAFADVDVRAVLDKVLALPITTWEYKASTEGAHMGPVAEDFHAAFGLGDSDRSISSVDADGVALAAIQGLYQTLQAENAALSARLMTLEQRLSMEVHDESAKH